MRKLFFALSILMLSLLAYSCTEKDNPQYELSKVKIQLVSSEDIMHRKVWKYR